MWVPVLAALGAGGFLFVIWLVFPAGMGLGDAKFALLLGAVLGLSVIPAMGVAFAAGALIGIAMIARHGAAARKTRCRSVRSWPPGPSWDSSGARQSSTGTRAGSPERGSEMPYTGASHR